MSDLFFNTAKRSFSFLEDAGFRIVSCESTRLSYETDQVVVTISWDPRSGELDIYVGRQSDKDKQGGSFSLEDILGMQRVDVPGRKTGFQVADESRLGAFLDELAKETRDHAQPALAGDRMFFHRLEVYRSAQAKALMQDMELRHIRTEAEKLWQERKFNKLIGLYTPVRDQLTESEQAKLAYAMKHAAKPA